MKTIFAIDPGPTQCGFVAWDGSAVIHYGTRDNADMLTILIGTQDMPTPWDILAIEMVACYGMPVGAEVFETCVWIGMFMQASRAPVQRVFRKDIKMHLCHNMRAKDSNIRCALIDKHGPPGTKRAPGKLYGISGHVWAAMAVADYVSDKIVSEAAQ